MNSTRPLLLLLSLSFGTTLLAGDWPRFRGTNGSGIAPDDKPVPVAWSATKNLKWKADLPGPGSSSPIVVGERIFVTYWSGYADSGERSGDISALKRHLICVDRTTGKVLWDRSVPAKQPEEQYGGMFAQNGYASHTPVSDGGDSAAASRPGGNQGGFSGGGRRGGGSDYASPVAARGHLYQVTRRGEVIVLKLGPKFELIARNRIEGDTSDHSATPAISNGQLFLRSAKTLYCIGE